jgi:D-tyrosyl-tRNA(Tyr) deacylase
MRAVLQRVTHANVQVSGVVVGQIDGQGLVAFVAATHDDGPKDVETMARKIAELRIFANEQSAIDVNAQILVVSQFTLYGDTRKGRRPSWSQAAPGAIAEPLINDVVESTRSRGLTVATGEFGANMQVTLTNDGPVTLLVDTRNVP